MIRVLNRAKVALGAVTVVGVVCTTAVTARAQSESAALRLDVLPRGAVVELKGPQHLISITPNLIARPTAGWYEFKASMSGYETWKQDLYIDPNSPVALGGTLSPKTRAKAGLRAIVFPGWGHYYSGRTVPGVVFSVATFGMVGGWIYFAIRADDKVQDYEDLLDTYNDLGSVEKQEALLPFVNRARADAYNAESDRETWGWITLGLYGYQILDAIVFFPSVPRLEVAGAEISMMQPVGGNFGVQVNYDF